MNWVALRSLPSVWSSIALGLSLALTGCSVATEEPTDDQANDVSEEETALRNQTADELAAGKADNGRCSGVLVPDRHGFDKKIALSFDDGPDPRLTPQVLDILDRFHAKAVFFQMGKHMLGNKELMQDILDRGHLIGSHTYSHPNMAQLVNRDRRAAVYQVEKTHSIVVGMHLKTPDGTDYVPKFFRFPYGSSNCKSADIVKDHGYIITGWHIDSADWCFGASRGGVGYCSPRTFGDSSLTGYRDDIVGYVVHQAERWNGGVMLFHDVHAYTVQVLPSILEALVQDGFRFVRIDDKDTFPLLNGADPKERPWVGTKCTKGDETCDFVVGGKEAFCEQVSSENEGFCSLPCEGYCPDRYGAAPTFCVSLDGGNSGVCVSKADPINHDCADLPGTERVEAQRFVGSSSAPSKTAVVCKPVEK